MATPHALHLLTQSNSIFYERKRARLRGKTSVANSAGARVTSVTDVHQPGEVGMRFATRAKGLACPDMASVGACAGHSPPAREPSLRGYPQ